MKFASFLRDGQASWGQVVGEEGVIDLGRRLGPTFPTLKAFIEAGLPASALAGLPAAPDLPLQGLTMLPPVTDPLHIWCLALNYVDHHAEVQSAGRVQELPKYPAVFTRTIDTFTGHGQPLRHPGVSEQFDYEGELAVVIGKGGHRIRPEDAFEHVAGYTILNDGSVRDWQFHTKQITPGKNFWRSGAIGPWMVTRDEIPDVDALNIRTTLNGAVLQDDPAGLMVHKIPRFIEYVSSIAPLRPGDILATGTPSGVGFSRKPPVWMKVGDVCEVAIDRIGVLRNPVAGE